MLKLPDCKEPKIGDVVRVVNISKDEHPLDCEYSGLIGVVTRICNTYDLERCEVTFFEPVEILESCGTKGFTVKKSYFMACHLNLIQRAGCVDVL